MLMLCGAANTAWAQRGEAFATHEQTELHRNSRYPGSFDTGTLEPGQWSLDLPWGSVWYGATDDLTIGTNLLAVGIPASLDGRGLNMTLRYRLWSRATALSTLTVTAGYADIAKEGIDLRYGVLTSSTTLVRPWGVITGSVAVGRVSQADAAYQPSLMTTTVDTTTGTGLIFALSYDRFFTKRLGVQATVGSVGALLGSVDTVGGSARASDRSFEGLADRSAGRFLLQTRVGRWLMQGGAFVAAADLRNPGLFFAFQWTSKP